MDKNKIFLFAGLLFRDFFVFNRMRVLLTTLLLFSTILIHAQGQADWWYFGSNAGVHFTSSGPVAVNDGQLTTFEGCASISDQAGNLQFYTDGIVVYDKNHTLMPNGTGLLGNSSSTHSGIIVPRPGSSTDFYVFTVDDGGNNGVGMYYSKVDLSLNSGNGDVVTSEKNVALADSTSEKVAAVKKANGYWIITHKAETNQYYTYEDTSAGVNTTPVISNTAWNTAGFGYGIAVSTAGTKLASVYFTTYSIHVYDVNLVNGQITSVYKIGSTMSSSTMYGLEFSPTADILYMQSYAQGDVRQFDLTAGNSAAISASEVIVGQTSTGGGQMQTGPDGKIYCARQGQLRLSVIEDPDVLGSGCNWVDTAIVLTASSRYGLPTFIQSFFNISFNVSETCFGDSTFVSLDTNGVDSVKWNFGDPSSGALNTSEALFASHFYADTGLYEIELIAYADTLTDTSYQSIQVYPRQSIDLGEDTLLCRGAELEFLVTQPFAQFLWQDSSTADTFLTIGETFIKVTVFGVCDTVSDSVNITYDDTILIDLGPDTLLCGGQGYTINSNINTAADLAWSNGDSSSTSIVVSTTGNYYLIASNACGTITDSVEVTIQPIPTFDVLGPDTINCFDDEIVLEHPDSAGTTYIWSDSTIKKTYRVDTTEIVWLASFNECGSAIDTINIIFNGEIISELGEDTTICNLDSIVLHAFSPGASYLWSTGDTTNSIVTLPDSKLYTVTVTEGFCTTIESKRVDLSDVFCPSIDCRVQVANVITPNGDGMNDTWKVLSDCKIREFDLRIFNRWGQLVFSSDNANVAWDGTVNGAPAADGIYYYEMIFKDTDIVDVVSEDSRGSITLIRD
jgi:gliding motility-associated-like protein